MLPGYTQHVFSLPVHFQCWTKCKAIRAKKKKTKKNQMSINVRKIKILNERIELIEWINIETIKDGNAMVKCIWFELYWNYDFNTFLAVDGLNRQFSCWFID